MCENLGTSLTYDEKLELYEALIAAYPDLRRKGKASAYTSMNGNMFSFLTPAGELCFRLGGAQREAFLEECPEALVTQYGRVMKHYVEVPDEILGDRSVLESLFADSVANARTLKPEATKRKKK